MSRRLMEMPTKTRPSSAADAPTCASAKLAHSPISYAKAASPRREKLAEDQEDEVPNDDDVVSAQNGTAWNREASFCWRFTPTVNIVMTSVGITRARTSPIIRAFSGLAVSRAPSHLG